MAAAAAGEVEGIAAIEFEADPLEVAFAAAVAGVCCCCTLNCANTARAADKAGEGEDFDGDCFCICEGSNVRPCG